MESNKGREDHPQNINPDEVSSNHPAKEIKAQEKIDIKESGLGREQGQTSADEHIDASFSQIDNDTRDLHAHQLPQQSQLKSDESHDNAGYMNDETSADRDTGNSNDGNWEASRTARHK